MVAWLSTLFALTSLTLGADGKPGVAVLAADGSAPTGAFVENMRIQLTDLASVVIGPLMGGHSRAEKTNEARQHLLKVGAAIAVWEESRVDPASGKAFVVVVAVTREASSDAIEVAELEPTGGPEDDRLLALKVGELLYQALSVASSEQELAAQLASHGLTAPGGTNKPAPPVPAPPRPQPAPRRAPPRAPEQASFAIEGGGGLRVDRRFLRPQVTGKLGLDLAYGTASWRAELSAFGVLMTPRELSADNGRLSLREGAVGGSARGLFGCGPLSVGVHTELAALFVSASATALDGRGGQALKVGSVWAVGPEGRLRLGSRLEMRALVAWETTMYAQHFAIEDAEIHDRDAHHALAELSLLVRIH